jgi:hypothetical protein
MGADVKLLAVGTVTVVIIAWVLTHASQAAQVTSAGASGYATAVKALLPPSS